MRGQVSYQRERAAFLLAFGREFPTAHPDIAHALLRAATGSQRYNEVTSSIDGAELADESGDPRGFPFVIKCPSGRTYDFGGRGLGIPGRGLFQ